MTVKESFNKDERIRKILDQVVRYSKSDFSAQLIASDKKDEADEIIEALNILGEKLKTESELSKNYEKRIDTILDVMLKFALSDFSQKAQISEAGDGIDALAVGLNTMSEELESSIKQLKNSEQQIQTIFDAAPDAVIVIDSESIVTNWNQKAEVIFGWKTNEIIGKPLYEFIIPTRFRESHQKGMKHFLKTGEGNVLNKSIEIEAIDRQGIELPVSLSISPVRIGEKNFFIGFVRDITEQKKAQKKILELAAIVESSDDAIISISLDKIILSWNKGAEKMYGYSPEEAVGKSISIIASPDQVDELLTLPGKFGKGEQIVNIDIQKIRKDGRQIYVSITASAIKNNANKITGISAISRDITEKKKMEAEILTMAEGLKRSNIELEQFAYVASHDLQEPLRMVTSYLQLLESRYKDKLDKDANDFIAFAIDGSHRMRALILNLLEYSRINQVRPFEIINLNVVIDEVLINLSTMIKQNKPIIKIDKLPKITGDKILISRLFQNLIENAIKFRSSKTPIITIWSKKGNNEYVFSVKDNGIGIQKEYLDKIFVIFQRLHSKEKYPGTGIGLAICKKIVEKHGGKIWVESEVDKGSTFNFSIKN